MKLVTKLLLCSLSVMTFVTCQSSKDPVEQKINNLISQMTLEEKIGQMNQLTGTGISDDMMGQIRDGRVGSILNELDAAMVNELQHVSIEESRLKIPLIFARDVIHGFKTIFPIPLGQAASWNPQVVKDGARVAAEECSSVGIRWTFAPMVDVSRDPRWGRIAESFGEDPYLSSIMGVAMVQGFQGDNLSAPNSVAACVKHFAAYGASESGKDYNTTWIPEGLLRDVYLPPFYAAQKAGAASVMCSFNDINGVPSSGNIRLNRQILRDEWKYDGVLVSDWGSIEQMIPHGYCTDLKDAAYKAAEAGVDMDMMGYAYTNHLKELVLSGKVAEEAINESVRNILRMKFRLGLFDNPYVDMKTAHAFYKPEFLEKAKQAAIEGAVLLKNENQVLPLGNGIKSVAVVGPLSDSPADQIGTWCFDAEPEHCITPLVAIQKELGNKIKVFAEKGLAYSRDKDPKGIEKAVQIARNADIILLFAGEEAVLSGEARCRADLSLPGAQPQLVAALKKTGKPVVLVIMAGRPLTVQAEVEQADAVVYAFHGGTMAGPALSDILFGKAVPSGKLPVTIPRMVGQVPVYYAHKNTGRPARDITLIDDIKVGALQTSIGFTSYHLDAGDAPLYPFGYGLSYTTFRYDSLKLSSKELTQDGKITVSCNITNTGKLDGYEVAQLYVRDLVGSLVRPVKELKGFDKVFIKAGETRTVSFDITPDKLAFYTTDNQFVAEPGTFNVWIGSDSQSGMKADFTLK